MPVTNYYKQNVYDPSNNKIGEVDDVLLAADGKNQRAGGRRRRLPWYRREARHRAVNAVKADRKDNKRQLVMNSTKDELKAAPGFKYDRTNTAWVKET